MIIAREKKQTNIAEYIIYMWQVEDLVRACRLDINIIKEHIIDPYPNISSEDSKAMTEWYENLIETIKVEHIEVSGHTKSIQNTLDDLQQLHNSLLKQPDKSIYGATFYRVFPHIQALKAKNPVELGEIELCFNALYGVITLRMKGKDISPETKVGIDEITSLIRQLTVEYHKELNDN